MALLKNVLGLDLGSHGLKCVEVRQTLRSFEATTLCATRWPGPDDSSADALRSFVRDQNLPTEHVVAALRGDRISSRRLSFPFSEPKKITAAIPFEVEEDLPFPVDDCLIDWESVLSQRGSSVVIASVAQRAEVGRIVGILRAAGCPPHTLEAEGLVLGNLAALYDLPGTRLLIDLGHSKTTCCALVEGRAIAARTIPLGGRHLTEAIALERGVELETAERIKCEGNLFTGSTGGASPRPVAVIDRLARELLRTVSSLEAPLAALASGPIANLTLLGGGARLAGIDEALAERTQIPSARLGRPLEGHGERLENCEDPALYAPGLALALRGTAQARTRTNFLQDEFAVRIDLSRYRRDFGSTAILGGIAILLAAISFAISTVLDVRRAEDVETMIQEVYSGAFPGKPAPENVVAAFRQAVRDANQRAEFLGVYPGNLSALDVLSEISKLVPADLDIVFEELSIDRQTIRMRVYSKTFESADRLGAELAKFAPFNRTQIGSIENDPKRNGKRFTVTITLTASEEAA